MRWIALCLLVPLLAGCSDPPEPFLADLPRIDVQSLAYPDGKPIPVRYSCDGEGVSIPLSWQFAPQQTTHYAMIFEDPDAPGGTFTHWVWWDMPEFNRAVPSGGNVSRGGAVEGLNSAGELGYLPVCPPEGQEHRHYASVFALWLPLELPPTASMVEVRAALEEKAIAKGSLMGTYAR